MPEQNSPFPSDPDRNEIWTMLVQRDITAYARGDWAGIEADFVDGDQFVSVDARKRSNPDAWQPGHTLDAYRESWLAGSARLRDRTTPEELAAALHDATTLRDIEIAGDDAVAHKKLDGAVPLTGEADVRLDWQTLFLCRRIDGRWRIRGFIGYLPSSAPETVAVPAPHPEPLPGGRTEPAGGPVKRVPSGAAQHVTAGPYSPVLTVDAGRLVVISGQAAITEDGSIVGTDVEEQTRLTLENCRRQLASAGCDLADVIKVNVYLTDMALWPRFNDVYATVMPEPHPVRTAVGTTLLDGLLVEVEMWAATAAPTAQHPEDLTP